MAHGFTVNLPDQDCELGYSEALLAEKLPQDQYHHLMYWMRGQTMCICTGQRYNHDTKEYESTACAGNPHGSVLYPWDVKRWVDGGGPLD